LISDASWEVWISPTIMPRALPPHQKIYSTNVSHPEIPYYVTYPTCLKIELFYSKLIIILMFPVSKLVFGPKNQLQKASNQET
jgi:hypothetical protein